MNPRKVQIIIAIILFVFTTGGGYAEVKLRSINTEKRIIKVEENIEEIKKDITKLLVKQERVLTILESWATKSN